MTQPVLDYLVIGHVTRDIVPGGWRAGGTVTFSALTAYKLGCRVGALTSATDAQSLAHLQDIAIHSVASAADTIFENIYTPTGRIQYLRSVAAPLGPADLPPEWLNTSIVHLGPVAQEVSPEFLGSFKGALIGLTPGLLRRWNDEGQVFPVTLQSRKIPSRPPAILARKTEGDTAVLRIAHMSQLLVQTCGMEGAIVYTGGSKYMYRLRRTK